ncbi:MAG: substrate-binding domain-containing protein [Dermatophilaceae bacterium]
MRTHSKLAAAILAASALTLSACAPSPTDSSDGDAGTDTTATEGAEATELTVGMLTSLTGPLGAYGEAYQAGFEAGWDYVTEGDGELDGFDVTFEWVDDQGNPDTAVSQFKDLVGQDVSIIAGSASSGIAAQLAEQAAQNQVLYISGPAATDALTGVNEYTFRSGRQTYQDVATAGTFLDDIAGKSVLVFAQDNAFGQGNVAGVEAVLGGAGAEVSSVLVAEDATEFTPFATQIVDAAPDLVFVAWAGATTAAMWEALGQQGVFDATTVVTGLGDVASYQAYGEASEQLNFLNHYFGGAGGTEAETAMIEHLEANGAQADLFSPDGFLAAQMVAHALTEGGGTDVDAMVGALEGATFDSVKGQVEIRAEDHAVIQPMFQARLVAGDDGSFTPELVTTVDAETVAPPAAG